MAFRIRGATIIATVRRIRKVLRYSLYDWKREMPRPRRLFTSAGLFIQAYALYAMWTRSLMWPVMWPPLPFLFGGVWLLYLLGYCITNVTLTLEFLRKTQLESDQIAARQVQRTLHPQGSEMAPGYEIEMSYSPYRDVGGDYFDIITLPDERTLFVIADVSGKGMPAALLAANIQALVRTMSSIQPDPLILARQINQHLNRYTPPDRFATAVFVVLNRDSGMLSYVNAGHNAPMLYGSGAIELLESSGLPLGLFANAQYEARTEVIDPGGSLLLFTDGLPDSMAEEKRDDRLRAALTGTPKETILNLKALVDPEQNEDDVTLLLIRRCQAR